MQKKKYNQPRWELLFTAKNSYIYKIGKCREWEWEFQMQSRYTKMIIETYSFEEATWEYYQEYGPQQLEEYYITRTLHIECMHQGNQLLYRPRNTYG